MSPVSSLADTIAIFRALQSENSTLNHFAQDPYGMVRSTMYLTPFAYQFIIYNSLYQIDWAESIKAGETKPSQKEREKEQQAAFDGFLREKVKTFPTCLNNAFLRVETLPIGGSWTRVIPDSRITEEQGVTFFNSLAEFQVALRQLRKEPSPPNQSKAFDYIPGLRSFVYDVRCNIFHGRKSLAEAQETSQNRRIEVYYRFLNGLVTLFFQVMQTNCSSCTPDGAASTLNFP